MKGLEEYLENVHGVRKLALLSLVEYEFKKPDHVNDF